MTDIIIKSARSATLISCNIMGNCALPDMYARSPRAEGVHIRLLYYI